LPPWGSGTVNSPYLYPLNTLQHEGAPGFLGHQQPSLYKVGYDDELINETTVLHDKKMADTELEACLPLIERGAADERNFVKKGVSWALRAIGTRAWLWAAASQVAERLAGSEEASCRWVGKDAWRDFAKARVRKVAKGRKKEKPPPPRSAAPPPAAGGRISESRVDD